MRLILILLITQTIPSQAQANWREQPKWLGIGITIGIATGNNIQLETVAIQAALAKTIWDLNNDKGAIEPFIASYGAYTGSIARAEIKRRKKNKVIKPGRLAKRITNRKCWAAY